MSTSTSTLRVLIIDDSVEDVMLLLRDLRRSGYQLDYRHVSTPEDIEAAMQESWQIVISDWSMPDMTGLDAFMIVRRFDPDLPFIIVSGTIGEEIAVDALRAGVHDFMTKGKFARLAPTIERELREVEVRRRERRAEAELAQHRRETERAARMFRAMLDSVPDAVIVTDRERQLLFFNPEASRLLGCTADDSSETWFQRVKPCLADKVTPVPEQQRVVPRLLRGDTVERELFWMCRDARTRDGFWAQISGRAIDEERVLVVFRDVTHEKLSQEQLLISDRMASVGMLAAGVAHEINNPLAAVIANLDMGLAITRGAEPVRGAIQRELAEMLQDAHEASDRVRQIVRDLKVFSRHEDADSGAVDVRQALESSLRMARNEIRHRAHVIEEYAETPLARGSDSRLGQVFLNLIVNAAQAIPEGAADRNKITVRTFLEDRRIVVEIGDTGTGMADETVGRLFTPFFTTKPQGRGTGLGLAISHRIVANLGGEIRVDSVPGIGTTFRVFLPMASEPPASGIVSMPPDELSQRARILVIDDDMMVAKAAMRVLTAEHDVITELRATDAVERIRRGEVYDVILCDLMMPDMTGMELYAQLEQIAPDCLRKVCFMTGGAFTQAAREFLDTVPNLRIEKPFDATQLRAFVRERVR